MPTSDAAVPEVPSPARRSGILGGLRALVRQLAAAVYVYFLYGVTVHFVRGQVGLWVFEPVLVLVGALLTARLIDGPWWTSSFVGLFVGIFDALVATLNPTEELVRLLPAIGLTAAEMTIVGAVGAWIGRRWRRAGGLV